jgi:hypothetical protein
VRGLKVVWSLKIREEILSSKGRIRIKGGFF